MECTELANVGEDIRGELKIDTRRLDLIEGDGVNVECVNSSDFIVGKQTNFNGPVTIINYAEGNETGNEQRRKREEVVIKEKILALSTTSAMENFVMKKAEYESSKRSAGKDKHHPASLRSLLMMDFLKIPVFAWILILIMIVGGAAILIVELVNSDESHIIDADVIEGTDGINYTFYSRRHWRAAAEESSVLIKLPVSYVIISNSDTEDCNGSRDCGKLLRNLQQVQTKSTGADIYSNFFVSLDGSIFEARGWSKRNEYQGFASNRNIDINFIGHFYVFEYPSEEQIGAARALIDYGVRTGKIQSNYDLIAANSTGIYLGSKKPSLSAHIYEIIKEWPNFVPNPYGRFYGFT